MTITKFHMEMRITQFPPMTLDSLSSTVLFVAGSAVRLGGNLGATEKQKEVEVILTVRAVFELS